MKRWIHASTDNIPHLSEIVPRINSIIFCEDILRQPCIISASEELEDLPDGMDLTDEQALVTLTDEQLSQIETSDVRNFTNPELLNRIARIDKSKLSFNQIQFLKQYNRQNQFIIDENDVKDLIEKLGKCTNISYPGQHWKTNKFALDSSGNLRKSDCLDIIHNLEVGDYVASGNSDNLGYLGNNIIIFEPTEDWKTNTGIVFHDLIIYVKLDIDQTDDITVAIISIHQTTREDSHPYA